MDDKKYKLQVNLKSPRPTPFLVSYGQGFRDWSFELDDKPRSRVLWVYAGWRSKVSRGKGVGGGEEGGEWRENVVVCGNAAIAENYLEGGWV